MNFIEFDLEYFNFSKYDVYKDLQLRQFFFLKIMSIRILLGIFKRLFPIIKNPNYLN